MTIVAITVVMAVLIATGLLQARRTPKGIIRDLYNYCPRERSKVGIKYKNDEHTRFYRIEQGPYMEGDKIYAKIILLKAIDHPSCRGSTSKKLLAERRGNVWQANDRIEQLVPYRATR